MRMLFTSSPGVGHLLPVLPVAVAARHAGHDVVVGVGASLAPMVARADLHHVALGPADLDGVRAKIPGIGDLAGPERTALMVREGFGRLIAGSIADDVLALFREWRADILVHEDLELGGWIAAERLGVPHVTIQATAWRPAKRAAVSANLDEIRIRVGLAPDTALARRDGKLWFTTRPPSLRDPAQPMPAVLRELRPEPDDRVGGELADLPDWLARPPLRRRVAVTLGTVNAHRVDLVRPIVDGLADLDVEVVVALGADPASLGAVPDAVRVERYVPMSQLLPRSTVVVHHAGSGTTLAALLAGRPAALVPIMGDQPDNTDRCVAAGAAIALDSSALTAEAVRAAVFRLLEEPRFADRAAAIAAEIRAMPNAAAALAEIEDVASGPATQS